MLLECYIKNGQGGENSLIHLVRILKAKRQNLIQKIRKRRHRTAVVAKVVWLMKARYHIARALGESPMRTVPMILADCVLAKPL